EHHRVCTEKFIFPTDSSSQVNCSTLESGNRLNGNNILDSSPCGLRVDWSCVRVFSWFALQMNHEDQTTKSHEPGITKRHKGSADESSMLLPLKRFAVSCVTFIHRAEARCECDDIV